MLTSLAISHQLAAWTPWLWRNSLSIVASDWGQVTAISKQQHCFCALFIYKSGLVSHRTLENFKPSKKLISSAWRMDGKFLTSLHKWRATTSYCRTNSSLLPDSKLDASYIHELFIPERENLRLELGRYFLREKMRGMQEKCKETLPYFS